MEGQTLFLYGFNVVRLNHLARIVFDSQLSAVQVSDCEVNTCESLQQSDFLFDKQISAFTFKNFVRLFLHNDNNITGFDTWEFIGLAVEDVLLIVGRTLVNLSIKNFLLFYYFFTIAHFAFVLLVYRFTLSSAIITRTLRLSVHTWSKLLHTSYHASTFAS